jgi:hypothetical protein
MWFSLNRIQHSSTHRKVYTRRNAFADDSRDWRNLNSSIGRSWAPTWWPYCWSGAGSAPLPRVESPNQIHSRDATWIPGGGLSRLRTSYSRAGQNVN